jgi:hypothetical protein
MLGAVSTLSSRKQPKKQMKRTLEKNVIAPSKGFSFWDFRQDIVNLLALFYWLFWVYNLFPKFPLWDVIQKTPHDWVDAYNYAGVTAFIFAVPRALAPVVKTLLKLEPKQ